MAPLDIECGNSDKQPIVVVTPPISSTSTGTQADDNVTEVAVNNNNSGGNVTRSRPPVQIPIGAEASIQSNSRNYNSMIGADPGGPGICAFVLTLLSFLLILATFPLSLCFSVKVVQEYERAVIFRLGRLLKGGARGPGIFFVVPCIDTYRKVDLRTVSFDVPPQEILSRDSVTVAVDAVVYYRVQNPTIAVSNVENFR